MLLCKACKNAAHAVNCHSYDLSWISAAVSRSDPQINLILTLVIPAAFGYLGSARRKTTWPDRCHRAQPASHRKAALAVPVAMCCGTLR
mmetsp:Transcript_99461/g.176475  ORF Transcript_99461/g.176475 Transcript_99461/m.176475 type:complete len:89 (-) Transcript_99461:959-1225(-)